MRRWLMQQEPAFAHGDWIQVYLDDIGGAGAHVRVEERHGLPGVVVLVLRAGEVALVDVFRPAIGQEAAGVPRGFAEGTDPRQDAAREVQEETGLVVSPDDLVDLGWLHPNDGLLSSRVALFAVEVPSDARAEPQDREEVRRLRWESIGGLLAAVRDGTLTDGFTHAVVLRALLRGLLGDQTTSSR